MEGFVVTIVGGVVIAGSKKVAGVHAEGPSRSFLAVKSDPHIKCVTLVFESGTAHSTIVLLSHILKIFSPVGPHVLHEAPVGAKTEDPKMNIVIFHCGFCVISQKISNADPPIF